VAAAATGTAAAAIGMAAVTGAATGTDIADVGTAVAAGAGAPQASPPASRSARGGLITAMAMVIPMEAMPTAIPITQRPLMAAAAWYGALITPRMERS